MCNGSCVVRVAVPTPVFRYFDYLPLAHATVDNTTILPGMRVRVPFGKRQLVGIVVQVLAHSDIAADKLRCIVEQLDMQPLLPESMLALLQWAARYYHHPPGEVFCAAIPTLLRKGATAQGRKNLLWRLTQIDPSSAGTLQRAPKQQELVDLLRQHPQGMSDTELTIALQDWRAVMRRLIKKACVEQVEAAPIEHESPAVPLACSHKLSESQQLAVDQIAKHLYSYQCYLLDGVTGSGKTEVYFQVIAQILAAGKQCLIVVPEIGLTPQLVDRFRTRFHSTIGILHSAISERERMEVWLAAKSGELAILIGTRSAVFTPLKSPGMYIIDEEHDVSFKQQDGFRYHGRDFLIKRAKQENVPIILGSATPSMESLANVASGRSQRLVLPERVGTAQAPKIHVIDMRRQSTGSNFSDGVLKAMDEQIRIGNQVLLFLNRRGFAPALLCRQCGWAADCRRCDAHMTYHKNTNKLVCHHCGAEQRPYQHCPQCGAAELFPTGYGTQRVEQFLQQRYADTKILRIDRDTTRNKNSLSEILEQVHDGTAKILIGTQMLAKGHHFPGVTLAVILSADQGFYSVDFRGSERMAQLIVQVAGRAGRAQKAGAVYVQTYNPEQPLLKMLIQQGYASFAQYLLREREQTQLPPYTRMAILRAEATYEQKVDTFLQAAVANAKPILTIGVQIYGPMPALMYRRVGRYRAQVVVQANGHEQLQAFLAQWTATIRKITSISAVRWSLDVDPMDTL